MNLSKDQMITLGLVVVAIVVLVAVAAFAPEEAVAPSATMGM
jgi:hypothetical protein